MSVIQSLSPFIDLKKTKESHPNLFTEILEKEYFEIGFKPSDVENQDVIDLGAHIGMFTMLCSACKARSILAIEANPDTFKTLLLNTSVLPSVSGVLNRAVFDGCKSKVFFSNTDTTSCVATEGVEVQCLSLDQILSSYNEDVVMKMDIEGSEYYVLPAVSKQNLRKCKTIFLETHRRMTSDKEPHGRSSDFLKQLILSFGFKLEVERQVFSWNIDANGRAINHAPIPNTQSFKFSRVQLSPS